MKELSAALFLGRLERVKIKWQFAQYSTQPIAGSPLVRSNVSQMLIVRIRVIHTHRDVSLWVKFGSKSLTNINFPFDLLPHLINRNDALV